MGIFECVLESKIKRINGAKMAYLVSRSLASVCVPYFGHFSTIPVNF